MKQIKAFTLIEIMVVIILSSIIVSISYYGFETLHQAFHRHRKAHESTATKVHFINQFELDFQTSWKVYRTGNDLVCWWPDKEIHYRWTQNNISRSNETATVAFDVQIEDIREKKVDVLKTNLIEELTIEIKEGNEKWQTRLYKSYPYHYLLQNELQ